MQRFITHVKDGIEIERKHQKESENKQEMKQSLVADLNTVRRESLEERFTNERKI